MLFIYVDVFWITYKSKCNDDVHPTIAHLLQQIQSTSSSVIMFVFWFHYHSEQLTTVK
jgi:hypothetical protein